MLSYILLLQLLKSRLHFISDLLKFDFRLRFVFIYRILFTCFKRTEIFIYSIITKKINVLY